MMKWFAVIFNLGLFSFLSFIGYLYLDERPVEIVRSVEAVKPVFHRNEPIIIRFVTDKLRDCVGVVTRLLHGPGDETYILMIPPRIVAGMNRNDIVLAFEFPRTLPAGRYEFQSIIDLTCNIIGHVEQVNPRVPFEVVDGLPPGPQ